MGDFNGDNYKDSFMSKLVDFVASDKFQTMFESFFIEFAMEFDYEEEHKLKYYELYQKFHDLFDDQLEDFCASLELSPGEFMKRCREATTEDPKASHYLDILLGSVEYDTFVKLMRIMRPVAQMRLGLTDSDGDAKGVATATAAADAKGGSSSGTPSKALLTASKDAGDEADSRSSGPAAADAKAEGKNMDGDDKVGSK